MKKKVIILTAIAVLLVLAGIFTVISLKNNKNDDLSFLNEDNLFSPKLEQAKLTFYFEAQEPKAAKEVLDEVEKKASMLKIKLDFQYIWNYPETYLSNIRTLISSGQDCDAFFYSQQFPQSLSLKALADEKLIKDITEEFPQYAPQYFGKFSKDALRAASSDNKIYAVPNHVFNAQMRCAVVRSDLMDKYGIPEIKSYKDYEACLKTIKEKEPDMFPMLFNETSIGLFAEANGYVILDYMQGLVYKWDDPEMKIMAWEQTPEFKEGIQTIYKWYTNGYLINNIGITSIDNTILSSSKWGSFITVLGSDIDFNYFLRTNNKNWRYKSYLLYPDKPSARNSPMDGGMVINAKSNNSKRVLMFIEWLQSNQENYDSLMFGIKGKHYILNGDSIALPEGVTQSESYSTWGWRWPFRNVDYERYDLSVSKEDLKAYYKIIEENTKYPPHMGFIPDYGAVTNITILRQMSYNKTEQSIYRGDFKPESIDEYIKEQKDEGADKLVDVVQKQLDEWRAKSQ